MFSKIRNRLTLFYTGIMVLFLLAFLATTYISLTWVLYLQQKQDILLFAEEEAQDHVTILRQAQLPNSRPEPDEKGDGTLFYYAFDSSGRRIHAYEPETALQEPILRILSRWSLAPDQVQFEVIPQEDGQTRYVILTSRLVQADSQTLGVVYTGKDITSYYIVLKTVLIVTLALCFIFLIAASWFGHLLASRAMETASIAFERQREFIADASHELRTPLSIMLASVETIQTDESSQLSSFAQPVLADMKDEILRMSKIVGSLLTLAHGDANAASIEKEQFLLNSLAQQVIRTFLPVANKKELCLKLITSADIYINADRQRMEQLLVILIDNAIKYTPDRGRVEVHLSAKTRHRVQISVMDTGIGIPEKDQMRIFERFYRVDKARSRETGGTGLGLSIAKWIVESHGGVITVKSSTRQGSEFIVTLPC